MKELSVRNPAGAITLADLLEGAGDAVRLATGSPSVRVGSVEYDSRHAGMGSLFVAVEGFQSDGHAFAAAAASAGASAIVVSASRAREFSALAEGGTALCVCDDTRLALSRLSAAFYGFPSSRAMVIGITGTNGKTSTTFMLESIARAAGMTPGVMGTINYRWNDTVMTAANTTPESRDIQQIMHAMVSDGVDCIVMEVSSHGLDLLRAEDIAFDAAVFTNLTRDHLDFHRGFEEYFAAKKRIFSILEKSSKAGRRGVINADDAYGRRLLEERRLFSYPFVPYAVDGEADYRPSAGTVKNSVEGISYSVRANGKEIPLSMRIAGGFNVYNSLCAFATASEMGFPPETIARGLADVETVPGRFDRISSPEGFSVIVDYAHTDDALEKLLRSARDLAPRRLITVFGCGGDRDRTKRPLMGAAAERLSDHVIVTSDNPRSEEPSAIINDILAGMNSGAREVVADREPAIRRAIELACEGDIVVIAGKGHENYQILGSGRIHFDDREMAHKYIDMRASREG